MARNRIPAENSKTNGQHKNAIKNFNNTTIADRLRRVSWSNNSHPTGVVKPVYGYPTFFLDVGRGPAWCPYRLVEQRTIFRQWDHISPYFTTIIFNVLKQILAISFICWVKMYLNFIGIKEIYLFLWKMQTLQEIKNKWRNMVTWRNMVLCSNSKGKG